MLLAWRAPPPGPGPSCEACRSPPNPGARGGEKGGEARKNPVDLVVVVSFFLFKAKVFFGFLRILSGFLGDSFPCPEKIGGIWFSGWDGLGPFFFLA